MNGDYRERIERARETLRGAERVLIGGGSGLSAAAGLTYSGARFTARFADFIEKYGMTDLYSAGFYPFPSEEARWAYWARHIFVNRFEPPALPLYRKLYALISQKNYFVVTTNVDAQFYKAGFYYDRIFAPQGDYGEIQCFRGCHDRVYDAERLVKQMLEETDENLEIPSELVPVCPVCGGRMDVRIRKTPYFVEDARWRAAASNYAEFLENARGKRLAVFEFGVGFNTPTIIRFPFERLVKENPRATLLRLNRDESFGNPAIAERTVSFSEPIERVVADLF